jgi:DNA-binding transcriptional LysR family regulator
MGCSEYRTMATTSLADLEAFVAVANSRSFRGAAYVRNVSASTLSEAVRRLEARLGLRLLNRTTRSVTPTEAGQRLLHALAPALEDVAEAIDAVHSEVDTPAGTLRLNVPSIAARAFLPGLLSRFLLRHPGIRAEVVVEDRFIDVLAAGFDAGIRYDERLEGDMIAIPIGPRRQRFITAASPGWLEQHGTPTHPDALDPANCIGHRFASGLTAVWEFERGRKTLRLSPAGRVVATSSDIEVAAAVAGLGLIHTFEEILQPVLDDGRLMRILDDWSVSFPGPSLYYPSRRQMPPKLRALVDFLREETHSAE